MSEIAMPFLFDSEDYEDDRGVISYINNLDLSPVVRSYKFRMGLSATPRAWFSHKIENKWFQVTKGTYKVITFLFDQNSQQRSEIKVYLLKGNDYKVLMVPSNTYYGIRAVEDASELLVFSDLRLSHSVKDDHRLDLSNWDI